MEINWFMVFRLFSKQKFGHFGMALKQYFIQYFIQLQLQIFLSISTNFPHVKTKIAAHSSLQNTSSLVRLNRLYKKPLDHYMEILWSRLLCCSTGSVLVSCPVGKGTSSPVSSIIQLLKYFLSGLSWMQLHAEIMLKLHENYHWNLGSFSD